MPQLVMAFFVATLLELNSVKDLTGDIRRDVKTGEEVSAIYSKCEDAEERLHDLEMSFAVSFLMLGIVAFTPWARLEKR